MTSTSSHRRSTIRRSTRRAAAAVTAFAVLVTACGSDDDDDASDDTTAASVAPATDAPADATSTTSPTATDPAPTTDGGAATGTGTAADEEFLELCPADGAPDSVTIAIWGSHPELVEPEMELFTDLTGVDIVWHTDGTADRLIKLNAERGAPTLDLAILPINEIGTLYENGVITAADPRVPNSDVLASVATGIPGGWGTSQIQFAIGYNPDLVAEPPTAWTDLLDPEVAEHVGFPSVPGSAGYGVLAMIARELGGDESDLDPAIDALAEVSGDILAYVDQAQAALQQMETGEMWMYGGIAGSMAQYQAEGGNIEVTIPESGGPVGLNVGVIPVGVEHEGCAMAALGWYLGPEVQGKYADEFFYTPVNTAVELDAEVMARVFPVEEDSVVSLDWQTIQDNADETMDRWMRVVSS